MEPFCGIWGKWISFLNSCFTQSQHSVVIWFYSLIYPSVGVQSVCHFLFTQGIRFFDIVVYTGNQVFWHRLCTSLFTQGIRFFDIVGFLYLFVLLCVYKLDWIKWKKYTTLSKQLQNQSKTWKEATSIPLTEIYMTAHFSRLTHELQ
jgi:hypothetical protein